MSKETGIIMSGNHPLKVIDGTKTMTRRTYGLEEINQAPDRWEYMRTLNDGRFLFWVVADDPEPDDEKRVRLVKCPYGQVGDRLWVREKALYWTGGASGTSDVVYSDDPEIPHLLEDNNTLLMARETTNILEGESVIGKWKWKPSIHMFRWASRITLEITEVRVELLRSISPVDALAEGGYTVEEFIKLYLKINHLPDDADPWDWVIGW